MNTPIILNPIDKKDASFINELKSSDEVEFRDLTIHYNDEIQKINTLTGASLRQVSQTNCLYVLFPWKNILMLIPERNTFVELRSSRNRGLISHEEQLQLRGKKIGYAGMNVGNIAAVGCALEGIGQEGVKLADADTVSVSNMNRFHTSISNLGVNKALVTERQLYEIDPFQFVENYMCGLDEENINDFLMNPKIDILVEETDDLKLKVLLREAAKKHRIPVVMVTGNAENVILDIERYDINSNLSMLNGLIDSEVLKLIKDQSINDLTTSKYLELCRDFIGTEYIDDRMQQAFQNIGNSLAGIPQLAECTFRRGFVLTYIIRQILLGQHLKSGRFIFDLSAVV